MASLLLVCVAHAALYELVLALVMGSLQEKVPYRLLSDAQDRILEHVTAKQQEDIGYTLILLGGLLVARTSGLVYTFHKRGGEEPRYWHAHRIDARLAMWLNTTRPGKLLKGVLDVLSFYVCFVSVMYFLGRFAVVCVNQRSSIMMDLPSVIQNRTTTTTWNTISNSHEMATLPLLQDDHYCVGAGVGGMCPAHVNEILLPKDRVLAEQDDNNNNNDHYHYLSLIHI